MSKPDFSDLTPPEDLIRKWFGRSATPLCGVASAARWGAQQAAEQMAGRWPVPITDRSPTKADANKDGQVQYMGSGCWHSCGYQLVARDGDPWRHTPNWQPKPQPLTEAQQIAADIRAATATREQWIRAAELLEAQP